VVKVMEWVEQVLGSNVALDTHPYKNLEFGDLMVHIIVN